MPAKGFLSSVVALPAFAQALDGYLIPVLYCLANFVLQGLFCLGESQYLSEAGCGMTDSGERHGLEDGPV